MFSRTLPLLAALLMAATAASAQEFGEQVSVSYVMVPFTVLGSKGAPIVDLRSSEVSLLVDGQPVATDMFEVSMNAPVSWTILLDGSGSMGLAGKMEAARAAISTMIARRRQGDDFALYVFAEAHAREVVPHTEDPARILAALDAVKPWGKTAFFDALSDMPERSQLGRNPTRAIVLLSDGIDNASRRTRQEVEKLLEGVAIPIYTLGLREPSEAQPKASTFEELSDVSLLDELSTLTGGKLFVGNRPEQLARAMDGIESNLRAQYLLGFSPTGKGAVKYRRISLQTAGRVRSVRIRAGYRGTEPPPVATATRGKQKRNERKKS
jgi:Ca-activated chloride channel family protein